ncbi:MAG TPA: histidine kinase [Solirubrobacteraceae bacterium]|nr:histidine kinase [Solirubrobacteraceae bacterium]
MSFGSFDASDRPDECSDGRAPRTLANRTLPFSHMPSGVRNTSALIWLAFIVFPLVNAIGKHGSLLQRGLIIAGAALFIAAYVTMVLTWRLHRPNRLTLTLFVVLLGLATALTVAQSPGWGYLFTYCAACSALVARKHLGFYAVALCAMLAAVTSTIGGANGGDVVAIVASTAGVGLLMVVLGDLRVRNQELSAARAELAELAVAQERERFARDLHDLLGHSLSVITLKAELAGRMLNDRPFDAAREISELEQVARTALGEVREAVSGYRQPTLDRELAGARMALSAAGIEAEIHQAHVPLDPPVEAVLAWTVREGATNVIRHSGARHCTLRMTASLTDAGVEVIDDGVGSGAVVSAADGNGAGNDSGTAQGTETVNGGIWGSGRGVGTDTRARAGAGYRPSAGNASGGHGLAGLAERARLINGTLEAGAVTGGGYRLAVSVPVSHS